MMADYYMAYINQSSENETKFLKNDPDADYFRILLIESNMKELYKLYYDYYIYKKRVKKMEIQSDDAIHKKFQTESDQLLERLWRKIEFTYQDSEQQQPPAIKKMKTIQTIDNENSNNQKCDFELLKNPSKIGNVFIKLLIDQYNNCEENQKFLDEYIKLYFPIPMNNRRKNICSQTISVALWIEHKKLLNSLTYYILNEAVDYPSRQLPENLPDISSKFCLSLISQSRFLKYLDDKQNIKRWLHKLSRNSGDVGVNQFNLSAIIRYSFNEASDDAELFDGIMILVVDGKCSRFTSHFLLDIATYLSTLKNNELVDRFLIFMNIVWNKKLCSTTKQLKNRLVERLDFHEEFVKIMESLANDTDINVRTFSSQAINKDSDITTENEPVKSKSNNHGIWNQEYESSDYESEGDLQILTMEFHKDKINLENYVKSPNDEQCDDSQECHYESDNEKSPDDQQCDYSEECCCEADNERSPDDQQCDDSEESDHETGDEKSPISEHSEVCEESDHESGGEKSPIGEHKEVCEESHHESGGEESSISEHSDICEEYEYEADDEGDSQEKVNDNKMQQP